MRTQRSTRGAAESDGSQLGYDPATAPNFDFFLRLLGLATQTSPVKLDDRLAALRRLGSL